MADPSKARRPGLRLRPDPAGRAVLSASVASLLLLLVGAPQPVRLVVAAALVAVLPGFGVVRLIGFTDRLTTVVASLALSLGLTTVVSTALTYLGWWSWQLSLTVLAAVAAVAACCRPVRQA
ncbi:MAG TPA: hypothetical protein VFJ97_06615 [Dermatophilaceae bacterium]|nr:hypothetical protein [Dermatophilaceae bacterium]